MSKKIKYWLGGFLHNSIIHPLMPFLPRETAARLHDWSLKFWPPIGEPSDG